jgi:hypothetical protein
VAEDRKQEMAERFPEAVAFARLMREVFGDGVKILYAKNGVDEKGKLE